jgi:hypothetical protein
MLRFTKCRRSFITKVQRQEIVSKVFATSRLKVRTPLGPDFGIPTKGVVGPRLTSLGDLGHRFFNRFFRISRDPQIQVSTTEIPKEPFNIPVIASSSHAKIDPCEFDP